MIKINETVSRAVHIRSYGQKSDYAATQNVRQNRQCSKGGGATTYVWCQTESKYEPLKWGSGAQTATYRGVSVRREMPKKNRGETLAPVSQFDIGPSGRCGHKSGPATILYKHNQNAPSDGSFRKRGVAVFINCEDGYGGNQKRACGKCRQAQQIFKWVAT